MPMTKKQTSHRRVAQSAPAPVKARRSSSKAKCPDNKTPVLVEYLSAAAMASPHRSARTKHIADGLESRCGEDIWEFALSISCGRAMVRTYPELLAAKVIPEPFLSVMLASHATYVGEDMPNDIFAPDYARQLVKELGEEYDRQHAASARNMTKRTAPKAP
jgi:hypothetical protein